jgi:hypothetical protein
MIGRQMRWYVDITTFNMKIHYRKGSENAQVDAISRREDYMKGEPKKGIQLLVRNADGTL